MLHTAQYLEIEQVAGYVTCLHQGHWWLAQVLAKVSENCKVKVSLLHPHGFSPSFRIPSSPNILRVALSDILTIAETCILTG